MKNFQEYRMPGSCRSCAPLLIGYLEQQLDGKQRARVEAHLVQCLACRGELAAAKAVGERLQGHRAVAARIETDLWSRIEADVRKLPRSAPLSGRSERASAPSRSSFLRESRWGQALPFSAAVFGVCILAVALVDLSHQHAGSASLANAKAPQIITSGEKTLWHHPTGTLTGTSRLEFPARAASIAARSTMPVRDSAGGLESSTIVRRRPVHHVSQEPRAPEMVATRSSVHPHGTALRQPSDVRSVLASAVTNSNRPSLEASERSRVDRSKEVASLSDRYIGGLNVSPLAATAPENSGAYPDQVAEISGTGSGSAGHNSGERSLASRGSYAVDDEEGANVSVADISVSVRRRQGLFSYTQQ